MLDGSWILLSGCSFHPYYNCNFGKRSSRTSMSWCAVGPEPKTLPESKFRPEPKTRAEPKSHVIDVIVSPTLKK